MKKHIFSRNKKLNHIKIAILHDAIIGYGGGEKILSLLAALFPTADIYTPVVFEEKSRLHIKQHIHTSFLQYIPFLIHARVFIQWFSPFIWRTYNLSQYDIIISIGGFYGSYLTELQRNKKTFHLHYCISHPYNIYTRPQHLHEVILNQTLYPILRFYMKKAMTTIPFVCADSLYLQTYIKQMFQKTSTVVYPPVEMHTTKLKKKSLRNTYCYIARLSEEKRVDIIIQAFNTNGLPLIIVGDGPLRKKLEQMAHKNISFKGFLSRQSYSQILASTKAYIHVSPDDPFPMAPLEAMSMGLPVIGYYGGGLKEMIVEGKTGLFFRKPTPASLNDTIADLQHMVFDEEVCKRHAKKFSKTIFVKNFKNMIMSEYETFTSSKNSYRS